MDLGGTPPGGSEVCLQEASVWGAVGTQDCNLSGLWRMFYHTRDSRATRSFLPKALRAAEGLHMVCPQEQRTIGGFSHGMIILFGSELAPTIINGWLFFLL